MGKQSHHARIRVQNDRFRTLGLSNGRVMVTSGIQTGGAAFVHAVLDTVRRFDAFTTENDPYAEHDFGALKVDGQKIFFKIDYYDPTLTMGSPDPADETHTVRVLTAMPAEEY